MTFEKFIKLIDILDHDGEILVMEDIGYEKEVCTISKYDDIFECMKYFKDSRYSLYIYENDKPYYEMKRILMVYFNELWETFHRLQNRPSPNKGKKLSEEHKRKISEALKRRYQ